MANKPPVQSVVVKTKKPTPLQSTLAGRQKLQQEGAAYDAAVRSGRILGTPADIGSPINKQAVAGTRTTIQADSRGVVLPPGGDPLATLTKGRKAAPLPNAPAKPAKVKLKIHPDGTISVTSHGHTQTAKAAPLPNPSVAPGTFDPSKPGTNPGGAIDHVPTTPKTRTPAVAAAAPAGKPALTDFERAQQQATLLLNPVIKQITDALNARSTAAQGAINGYTGELGNLFGLYSGTAGGGYDTAIADQSAIDGALADRLNGVTSGETSDLSSKLAGATDPGTAARVASEVSQFGTGASKAGYALRSADLSALVGGRANATDYGAKLPGVAGLYGLQATKQQQAKDSQDLATSLTQVGAQAPSLTESLLTGIRSDANQKAQLAFERKQFGVKTKATAAAATTKANTADATLSKAVGFLVNAQGDPILKGGKIVELPQSTSPRKANASLSKSLGYVVDAQGNPILRGGKKIVVPKASTASKVTPATRAKALGLARVGHHKGPNGEAPVTWQTYLSTGLSKGIPAEILIEEGRKVYTQAEIHQGLVPGSK